MTYRIAIDGPSGAGKSTIAKAIARQRGIVYVDTGAMYRTVGLYVKMQEVEPTDAEAVAALLPQIDLQIRYLDGTQHIFLCGEDVGDRIRTPDMSMYASAVSAIGAVRAFLLDTQRNLAKENSVVMDGRDIGTVIFPDAEVKIFLTASPEARARRRYAELCEKGIQTSLEEVLADMETRDRNDSTRALAPAVPAEDAVVVDSSDMTVEEVVAAISRIADDKLGGQQPPFPPSTPAEKKAARGRKVKKAGKVNFYTVMRFLLGGLLRLCWRVRIHGRENLPKEGGYVVCCNHIAVKDIFILAIALPRQLRFLGKAELFRIPLLRWCLRWGGAVPIDRGGSDVGGLKRMICLASEGELVGIFPQGTRCPGKNPADTPVKSGAGLIAYRAKAGMIPVCIRTAGHRYRFLRRKEVFIGKPVEFDALFREGGRQESQQATERIFADICALGGFVKTEETV